MQKAHGEENQIGLDDLFLAGQPHLRTASVWGGNPFDFFYLNPYQVVFLSDKTVRG